MERDVGSNKQSERSKLDIWSNKSEGNGKEERGCKEVEISNDFEKKLKLYSEYLNSDQVTDKDPIDSKKPSIIQQQGTQNPLKKQMRKVMEKMAKFQTKLLEYDIKHNINK